MNPKQIRKSAGLLQKTHIKTSKIKANKRRREEWSSSSSNDEEEDYLCIRCLKPWSLSNGKEWVQCLECKMWAHSQCAGNNPHYICHNCRSDFETDEESEHDA